MIYRFENSEPRWINFENPNGERGNGGRENNGAKGHACEHLMSGEEKILCNFSGCGMIRRIWITLDDRSPEVLKHVYLKMFWDNADKPQVNVPMGDFFCMGSGEMRRFENHFFSTAEGRSFSCKIPMPFRENAKIVLCNNSGKRINNLFYDINLTLEELSGEDMYFYASFQDIQWNVLEENVTILSVEKGAGRFLGTNIAVIPDEEKYPDTLWGEGEVKIYLDGDQDYPTLVGTGAEDYVGSAWGLGEFINDAQGCVSKINNAVSMYRFHVNDPIYFQKNIRVEIQAMGGGSWHNVKKIVQSGAPHTVVTYDDGDIHPVYKKETNEELKGYVNFFRIDHYRVFAYYYKKQFYTVCRSGMSDFF